MKPPFASRPSMLPSPRMRLPPPHFAPLSTAMGGNGRGGVFSPHGPPMFCGRGLRPPPPPFGRLPPFHPHMPMGCGRFPPPPPFGMLPNRAMKKNRKQPPAKNKKNEVKFNKPWIDEILQNEILKKHKMHQKARKSKKSSEWEVFREQRNKVTALLREAKMNFEGKKGGAKKDVNFYCDTCDRGFEVKDEMDEHLGQHQKCDQDGCTFEAHFKIVELHVKMQHDSGYATQISQLSNPETISKWRDQRKKNFPTVQRVAAKQAEQLENSNNTSPTKKGPNSANNRGVRHARGRGSYRTNRGRGFSPHRNRPCPYPMGFGGPPPPHFPGRMPMHPGGWRRGARGRPFHGHRPSNNAKAGSKKFEGGADQTEKKENGVANGENACEVACSIASKIKAEPKDPKADPLSYVLAESEEDSDTPPTEVKTTTAKDVDAASAVQLGGALGLLMNTYGSETEAESNVKNDTTFVPQMRRKCNRKFQPYRERQNVQHGSKNWNGPYRKHQLTLLQKLLSKEIQHETNVILQCVQYVYKNGFFGIGDEP